MGPGESLDVEVLLNARGVLEDPGLRRSAEGGETTEGLHLLLIDILK